MVHRVDRHACGQRLLDRIKLGLDRIHDIFGVFADARQRHAEHHLLAVAGDGAGARRAGFGDLGHVAHVYRGSVLALQHDVADVLCVLHQTQPAHQVLFAADVDEVAADLCVVGLQRFDHILEAELVRDQLQGIDAHLVLLFLPTP